MGITLTLDGIRCFSTPQTANVRPLTLLVGENSSGKTTFLAMSRIASVTLGASIQSVDFNRPPFTMGAFEQIVTSGADRKSFDVSASTGPHSSITIRYVPNGGHPKVQSISASCDRSVVSVSMSDSGKLEFRHTGPLRGELHGKFEMQSLSGVGPRGLHLPGALLTSNGGPITKLLLRELTGVQDGLGQYHYAFAPIRTSPKRTYDPVIPDPEPEGSHVPMYLASLARGKMRGEWHDLQKGLNQFGKLSGLYQKIEVDYKGKLQSDPFQIKVRMGGTTRNFVDVGYGVSQVLPLIVDVLSRAKAFDRFLVQQPEVHLHPKAQAELGSFFAQRTALGQKFMIETHSDYLVDRVRTEIRKKTLTPDQVSLLYFERAKDGARIHNIELDDQGSITNPPAGYRRFFSDEARAVLGF